jgi:dTDP-4-dehydrorhamnose reductase
MNILVTGANGQLGSELKELSKENSNSFVFVDVDELDITDVNAVELFFQHNNFDYCINSAAYTAVDKAEEEQELAEKVNVLGSKNLAKACETNNVIFIHVSTDFVFDGTKNIHYSELDQTSPINV